MDEKLMKQIVEAVMQELMAQRSNASACTEGLDKLLVIGDLQAVPADMAEKYQIFLIDDYIQNKNIHRYHQSDIGADVRYCSGERRFAGGLCSDPWTSEWFRCVHGRSGFST